MTLHTAGVYDITGPNGALAILHEFGHYALCLYDECWDASHMNTAHCADLTTYPHHCIMEYIGTCTVGGCTFNVDNFCTKQSHNSNRTLPTINEQQSKNGQSCLEHLSKNYCLGYALPAGATGADMPLCQTYPQYVYPPNPHPVVTLKPLSGEEPRLEYTAPQVIEISPESRVALLLDRSQSMTPIALSGVRFGAHFWTTYLSQTCERLGLIFFNQESQVLCPVAPLSDIQLGPILESLSGITPAGRTNLEGVLHHGFEQLMAPGYQASIQDLILVTDGVQNVGELPATWVNDLIRTLALEGIRLHSLGLGPHDDQVFLQRVTAATGGQFYQVGANLQEVEAQLTIQEAFINLAGEWRNGFGPVLMERGRLQEPTPAGLELLITIKNWGTYNPKTLDFVRQRLLNDDRPDIVSRYQAHVEEGSQQAAFITSYLEGGAVNVYLFRPGGEPVNPGVDADVRFRQTVDAPYAFYVVNEPAPGDWTVLVVRRQERREIPFTLMACNQNPDLVVAADVGRRLFDVDEPITIKAFAYYQGEPLTEMEAPIALVSMENELSPGVPEEEKIILEPQRTFFDAEENRLEEPVTLSIFQGVVSRSKPGSYTVRVIFSNQGKNQAPRFQRVRSLQIHVGPLTSGEDLDKNQAGRQKPFQGQHLPPRGFPTTTG